MIRLKLKPQAECQRADCGWGLIQGRGASSAVALRSRAERHVQDTGHRVNVTISDITEYSPQVKS